MIKLNLPEITFAFREQSGRNQIFDPFRKKYVAITPEEWVRQHFLHWLVQNKKFPVSVIAVEKTLTLNEMKKRYDAVVYSKEHRPIVLIEFKSPSVKILQSAFEQAARYNMVLKVPYLIVSNGINHYCCRIGIDNSEILFLNDIPEYKEL